jgi:hypothetical protein
MTPGRNISFSLLSTASVRLQIATRRANEGTGRDPSMLQDVKQGRLFDVRVRTARHLPNVSVRANFQL